MQAWKSSRFHRKFHKMPAEKVIVLLIVLSTVAKETDGSVQEIGQISLSGPLQNMQIYNGSLYIGGRNYIYKVDKDLHDRIFANSSGEVNSENDNQVLIANQKTGHLVICGTGNNGSCEVWDIDEGLNLTSSVRFMNVSSDINRPAVGMFLGDGNLMIAVTYGQGSIQTSKKADSTCLSGSAQDECLTYHFPISTRKPSLDIESEKALKFEIRKSKSTLDDYIIYYKSSFEYNGYSYFLTNQKEYVGGLKYVSKLIRICQNDTALKSYTDIFLTCHGNGAEYNLLQSAILVDSMGIPSSQASTKTFISTFTKGSDPEKPDGDSVICMISLSEIDEAIVAAKRDNYQCKLNQDELQMYLPKRKLNQGVCLLENQTV